MNAQPGPMVSGRYFFPNAPLLCVKWMPACEVMSRKRICWADAATLQRSAISRSEPTKPRSGKRMQPTARAVGELWSRDEPQRGERTVPHVKARSEERRVGKGGRDRGAREREKHK